MLLFEGYHGPHGDPHIEAERPLGFAFEPFEVQDGGAYRPASNIVPFVCGAFHVWQTREWCLVPHSAQPSCRNALERGASEASVPLLIDRKGGIGFVFVLKDP